MFVSYPHFYSSLEMARNRRWQSCDRLSRSIFTELNGRWFVSVSPSKQGLSLLDIYHMYRGKKSCGDAPENHLYHIARYIMSIPGH